MNVVRQTASIIYAQSAGKSNLRTGGARDK
jgi:hypothetical protein